MFLIIVILSTIATLVSSSDPSEVFVNVDESYFNTNKDINIAAGNDLTLTCASTVTGSASDIAYKWYLSQVPYTTQSSQRVLVSSSKEYSVTANSTHSGYYMCLITSEEGYSVFTPVLSVEIQYFTITTEHDSATIEPYEKVSVLKCSSINAYPTPKVTWKKDGILVNNINLDSTVMHVTGKVVDKAYDIEVDDLVILNYAAAYAGTYSCEVEATGTLFKGQTATAKSYTVRTAASTNKMTDNSTQILFIDNGGDPSVGDAITLKCGASGYPTPTYQWFDTNDAELKTSDTFEVLETSLKVKSITAADDNAEYKCKAKSGDSEYIEAIRLTLADVIPEFNSSMDNSQYNIPGATVTIDFGLDTTGQINLFWNGAGLADFVDGEGRGDLVYDNENNILKIENIQKNASGVFQCIVYNEAGVVTQYKTVIIRDAQPAEVSHTTASTDDITVIGNDIHSIRGANFTMQCTGSGNPTPSDITIDVPDTTSSKVGSNLVKVNSEGKYIGNLLIDSVNEDYSGSYNCCSYNFVSGVKHEACVAISLAVEEEVTVTQNSEDNDYSLVLGNQVYGTTGYELAAQCKATGLPRPTINATRINNCGTVSTITKSNDIELVDHVIIEVKLSNTTGCITETFKCCGNNTIQGELLTECYDSITMSFVDQEKPNDVKVENMGNLADDDDTLVSTMESLQLNCSAKSFPESVFVWMYKDTDKSDSTFQTMNSIDFPTSVVKSKGFTYSTLSTNGLSEDYLSGENYEFQCTASNVFGEATAKKFIQITSSTANEVSSSVYLGVGVFLFVAALAAVFVMYIFFIISSGKKKKGDLGLMKWVVCKCCEPKPQPVEYDDTYNASLYTDKTYAVKKVDLYPDIKHMTFDDDEFDRSNTIVFNPASDFDDRMFTMNTAVFKDPDIV